jgi:hypothetical protein
LASCINFVREIRALLKDGSGTDVSGRIFSAAVARADMPASRGLADHDYLIVFAFIALVVAELVLVLALPGINYSSGDGKAAQAEILATLEFARPFHITNLNPLQGLGSQMMPMNVWVNPAYWPFAFFHKELASEISGIIAFICYAMACYAMARCFDLPRIPSIIAAQFTVVIFTPVVLMLGFAPNFVSIPGLAIVYAPHLVAFGLLARLSPERPQMWFIASGLLGLLFYSLYCDPLWTAVSGLAWIVPFAVVTFSPGRRDTILARCAVLGGCVVVLLLSGALEYVYSLSQYTARVQFPDLLERPRTPLFTSMIFRSKYAAYFYCWCVPGWALGIWLLRGRARILVLAGVVSAFSLVAYAVAFLYSAGRWWLPVPIYIEHTLFALFWTAAIAGYWGGLEALAAGARRWIYTDDDKDLTGIAWRRRMRSLSPAQAAAAVAIIAVAAASFVPAVLMTKALKYRKWPNFWHEPWSNEPELRAFLGNNIGLRADPRFRGSVFFYTFQFDEFLTLDSLWVDSIPTTNEYSQLVTPQAIYFVHELFKRNVASDLNWFRPWINTGEASFSTLFRAFRALGVRYVGGYVPLRIAALDDFPSVSFPRRSPFSSGLWVIHEIPDVNVGNYSPTEITIAPSAAETIDALGSPNFEFSRQAVLSTELRGRLVPARDMRLSVIRGGLHLSGRSDGTSLVLLPQQFSNCLRAHDSRVRLVRADLILTGVIFSESVDTDISLDFGIFSPGCRRADLADVKQLGLKVHRE